VRYASSFPTALLAADLNGDGKLDLAASDLSLQSLVSGIGVFLGNGDGTFRPQQGYPTGLDSWGLAYGDLNGDKRLDLIIGTETYSGVLEADVLLNTGVVVISPSSGLIFPAQLIGTTSVPMTATITNHGKTAVNVSSVTLQGTTFREKTNCVLSLAPGEHCTVTAAFKPTSEGASTGTVTIIDTASSRPQVLELIAAGTVVSFSPPNLTFPPQKVGTHSAPMAVQVTNTGSVALNFTGITYRGDFTQSNTCGNQIGPGVSCIISVTFQPAQKGPLTGYVTVNDDGGGSPQIINLAGTGS
jgi:hypothetical protein